jgi:hypothetical protein
MKNSFPLLSLIAIPALLANSAEAQSKVRFSIDWRSAQIGAPDCNGVPITEGDVLEACVGAPSLGPLPAPVITTTGGPGGLGIGTYAACAGGGPGIPCGIDVDALSMGDDNYFKQDEIHPGSLWFSVDEFSRAVPGAPVPPNLVTEHPAGDSGADVMTGTSSLPWGPFPPLGGVFGHVGAIDGDGMPSASGYTYPGLGLVEGAMAMPGPVSGVDNLDALELVMGTSTTFYFSMDATPNLFDACIGTGGSESAWKNGFQSGDVLVTTGAGPAVYAPATMLGLNQVGGHDSDNLDALILRENGNGQWQPSMTPYDWLNGNTDMLLFSVSRSSMVVGQLDSNFLIPIEPGDILMPPGAGALSPYPGIFVPAEALGLATQRAGFPGACASADIDALDHHKVAVNDCNNNGIDDSIDIATGAAVDLNQDGVPDSCGPGLIASPFCFCAVGICGNADPNAGCANSTGSGARLEGFNSSSVALDDLTLRCTQLPIAQWGLVFRGSAMVGPLPFGDGYRCAGGTIRRLGVQNSGFFGEFNYGPGIVAASTATTVPILAGSTWNFQAWYRNTAGPCLNGFNLSNALAVTFY